MHQRSPGAFAPFAIGILISICAAGCATSSDLDALKVDLTRKLDAQTTKLRGEATKTCDETKSLRNDMQTAAAKVSAIEHDIRKVLDVQSEQDVMRGLMVREVTTALANTRKAMEGYGANIATLGSEVRSLQAAVQGSYELDEDVLKSRLRSVEEMKKRLGSVGTRQ